MKITLDIPNEHAPRLLALLADLMPVRLEPQADPAEGHPELPLAMPVAKWAEKTIVESTAGTVDPQLYRAFMAAAQAGKTGLTLKQIGRVMGDEISLDAQPGDESEEIAETRWAPIEGIDAADPLKVEMEAEFISPPQSFETASTVPPVVGERFYTRNGAVVKLLECNVSPLHPLGQYKASYAGSYYYYDDNGKAGVGSHFDLVQRCTF